MEAKPHERLSAVLASFAQKPKEEDKPKYSPNEIRFLSLLIAMEKQTVSFRQAQKIVGGLQRLTLLIDSGEIRVDKPEGATNRKWLVNAADCYRNVRPRLKEIYA